MSKELDDYINGMEVSSIVLSSDRIIIGKIESRTKTTIDVKSVFTIETAFDGTQIEQVLIPLAPYNVEQVSVIAKSHVIIETPAEFKLKKLYCDVLIKSKIESVINQSNLNNHMNLETTDEDNDNWNQNDRWKNL